MRPEPFQAGDCLPNAPWPGPSRPWPGKGKRAFYRGRIAEQIVADLAANGGFVRAEDLAGYQFRELEPIALELQGRTRLDGAARSRGRHAAGDPGHPGPPELPRCACGSPAYHHHLAQAAKMAFIDRLDYMGDLPLGDNATYRGLLSRGYGERPVRA